MSKYYLNWGNKASESSVMCIQFIFYLNSSLIGIIQNVLLISDCIFLKLDVLCLDDYSKCEIISLKTPFLLGSVGNRYLRDKERKRKWPDCLSAHLCLLRLQDISLMIQFIQIQLRYSSFTLAFLEFLLTTTNEQ